MWKKIRIYYILFRMELRAAFFPFTPLYATGGYQCDLCEGEMFYSGRLDDEFAFTRPMKCHMCQRKICDDCLKAREKVDRYGETWYLPVCVDCFPAGSEDERFVNIRAA